MIKEFKKKIGETRFNELSSENPNNTNYTHMEHMIKEFKKKIGETRFNELSSENPNKIIKNEII